MLDLTFGEQVKIVLSRKGMTIKELAEIIEERTGKKMSRQNLTQRLGRDNFQEQDMRMIADILGCPFQLSILADMNEVERASRIEDVKPTEKELSKLAKAKERKEERKEKRVEKAVEVKPEKTVTQRYIVAGSKREESAAAREVTIGEIADIPEKTEELPVEEVVEEVQYEEPVYEESAEVEYEETAEETPVEDAAPINELLDEIEAIESNKQESAAVDYSADRMDDKKSRGWRAMFGRRGKKEEAAEVQQKEQPVYEEAAEEVQYEEPVYEEEPAYYDENDYIDYESNDQYVEEYVEEEEVVEEEQVIGEINPYTGREYESNSVRMHPKRIGYVQVYDRSDHQWTDMTEWAFLGYQERKKALLGKDYEPPIYLD